MIVKALTASLRCAAWADSCSLAAALSSAVAAFVWTTSETRSMLWLICSIIRPVRWRNCDRIDEIRRFFDLFDNLVQRFGRIVGDFCPGLDFLHGAFDQIRRFLNGVGRLRSEIPNLLGDDGKTLPVLAGPGGFNGGVQCQDVGLECDIVNDFNDPADIVGGNVDLVHCGEHILHLLVAEDGVFFCALSQFVRFFGVLGAQIRLCGYLGRWPSVLTELAQAAPGEGELESDTILAPDAT